MSGEERENVVEYACSFIGEGVQVSVEDKF
jgi:hypothetical protein